MAAKSVNDMTREELLNHITTLMAEKEALRQKESRATEALERSEKRLGEMYIKVSVLQEMTKSLKQTVTAMRAVWASL